MEAITRAISAGAEAGKLRAYVRENGGHGLAGLLRLADRHSSDATAALDDTIRTAGAGGKASAAPLTLARRDAGGR